MKRLAFALALCLSTTFAQARIVSYAPYTDQLTAIAFQSRTTRHFLVLELPTTSSTTSLVLHDSAGEEEPRTIVESTGSRRIAWAAMYEDEREKPVILIAENFSQYDAAVYLSFTNDLGRTVKVLNLSLPSQINLSNANYIDNGGPFTRGRLTPVLIGNRDFPFVVQQTSSVYRVDANGNAAYWVGGHAGPSSSYPNTLLGADATRTRFLIRTDATTFAVVGFDGKTQSAALPAGGLISGWIAPDGRVYLETSRIDYTRSVQIVQPDHTLWVLGGKPGESYPMSTGFAVPTHDYSGAWIVDRISTTTRLVRHTAAGFELIWSDATRPEVEAVIAGASGQTLLLQVHRPRPQPDRIVTDPALAVWRIGSPPPTNYDELFLAEQPNKGFVHVDADRVGDGDPFVFDSGIFVPPPPQVIISAGGGGGDIQQEWGVVRGSLRQRLVLPGVGRALGAYGSNWTTDVTLYNPESVPQNIDLRFVQSGGSGSPSATSGDTKSVTLNAKEIRVIPDILGTLFGRVGNGALFLTPELSVNATSRTYTRSAKGSYGFGMHAIDVYAAASPRFPVTFAGAFPGPTFRTNVTLTGATGRGSDVTMLATGARGVMGLQDVTFGVPADGQQQINGLEYQLGVPGSSGGGLLIRPKRGFVVASVFAIDNTTNDPTYFPPDLNAAVTRSIPVIGHLDGAYGSQFRTDLYVYNPTAQDRSVLLQIFPWNTSEFSESRYVNLKAYEARVMPDVYGTFFNRSGLARLQYTSSTVSNVRVTSRTYTLTADGGTFGCLTPPINGFQMAAAGETLEIIGATTDPQFRTNLGIVELNRSANVPPASARVEVIDERGSRIDDFTVTLPFGAGRQINDLFRTRGAGSTPGAVLIRVTPQRGHITAYATVTDNTTNDSIYLAPYLKAQE